jgi:L-rhamnose-H+ transport protein
MQTTNLGIGLSLCLVSGFMLGAFALPQKRIRTWQWENYWASFTLFSAFVFPLAVALITIPSFFEVLKQTPGSVLLQVFGFGTAWGVANIGYGISIKKLGMAMALALVLGINNAVGTILPIVVYQPDKLFQPVGLWIITGILIMLAGIVLCSIAGKVREKEQGSITANKVSTSVKSSFTTGLIIAIAAGALAASFNFALVSGKPIETIAISNGANPANASNATWVVGLSGGFIVTLLYCIYLWYKNKTFSLFVAKGSTTGWTMTALMGVLWFGGVMLYGTSVGKLGVLGSSLGWPIIQSMSIGSGNVLGILSGEFNGAKKSLRLMFASLLLLFIGIVCIGYAGSLQ